MALKVAGIVLLAYTLIYLPQSVAGIRMSREIMGISPDGRSMYTMGLLFGLVMQFIVPVALILLADGISRLMVRQNNMIVLPDSIGSGTEVFMLALRIVGVCVIATSIPVLISTITGPIAYVVQGYGLSTAVNAGMPFQGWEKVISSIVAVAVGACLIWGMERLSYGRRHQTSESGAES